MKEQIIEILNTTIFASTNPSERTVSIHGAERAADKILALMGQNPTENGKTQQNPMDTQVH